MNIYYMDKIMPSQKALKRLVLEIENPEIQSSIKRMRAVQLVLNCLHTAEKVRALNLNNSRRERHLAVLDMQLCQVIQTIVHDFDHVARMSQLPHVSPEVFIRGAETGVLRLTPDDGDIVILAKPQEVV